MKRNLLFLLMAALLATCFSAKAQRNTRYGDDLLLYSISEDPDYYEALPKISVADNGWIYVLLHAYGEEESGWKLYRSKDGGASFAKLKTFVTYSEWFLKDVDFVVTGGSESDIALWVLTAYNKKDKSVSGVWLSKYDANGEEEGDVYHETYYYNEIEGVSISTNARSPEEVYAPFVIGFACTVYSEAQNTGSLEYVYSLDGGATFNEKELYRDEEGCRFRRVDISIGQALASNWYPAMGVVFEMWNGDERNIGFICGAASGGTQSPMLPVSDLIREGYSDYEGCYAPKIQWLCNNALNEYFNFRIVCEAYDTYLETWDIVKISPKPGNASLTPDEVSLDHLRLDWVTSSNEDEYDPDLSYDKANNNYMITYRTGGEQKNLYYKTQKYDDLEGGSASWQTVLNAPYASLYTQDDGYYRPVVDIDPSRNKACFAWQVYEEQGSELFIFFDSEWNGITGLSEEGTAAGGLVLSPNPAQGKTVVKMERPDEYEGAVYDMQGRKVSAFRFSGAEYNLDVSGLPSGIYMVHVCSSTMKQVGRIAVE